MTERTIQIRLAGRGGQGIMLAGFLLAHAGTLDGLNVVQTQSYGPEARLGAAKSDVIISPHQIAYPEIVSADVLVCLSRDAYSAYGDSLRAGALGIVDERVLNGDDDADPGVMVLPIMRTARGAGSPQSANVVALGALIGLCRPVSERAMREALAARMAPASLALNSAAFDAGLRAVAAVA